MSDPEQQQIENVNTPGPEKGKELSWGQRSKNVDRSVSADIRADAYPGDGAVAGAGAGVELNAMANARPGDGPNARADAGAGARAEPKARADAGAGASSDDNANAGLESIESEPPRRQLLSELIAEESRKNPFSNPPRAIAERWEIQNKLGQGGMSTVYKARHLVMNKICAVKILNPNLTSKSESLQRFQREAKAASSLDHPNIVSVLDCGVTAEQHAFLIMDYLEGESLGDLLRKEYKLLPDRAVPIFLQTCEALTHAHERSVVHRDLKPSNLMLVAYDGKKDFVKIVDFGIAKLLDVQLNQNDETHQRLTHTGDIFGSPLYMSPEQCAGKESDRRSDIYSMGCLMYETLTGVPPFVGANTLDTIRLKLGDAPPPLINAKNDRLLRRLNTIIQKCLEQDPADRYSTMELLRNDIILARDESEAVWHSRALANRKRFKGLWLQLTPRKVIVGIICAIALSIGTTIYCESKTSNLPSEYENKSLWTMQKFDVPDASIALKTVTALAPEGLPGAPHSLSNRPAAESINKELINKFIDADSIRVEKKYTEAAQAYNWAIAHWNGNEALDLPGAKWALSSAKAYYGLGLCKASLGSYETANDCFQQAIDLAQKDASTPPALLKDMQQMLERNLWKVNPVKAMMRVLSKKEMLPPGAS
jgi:serine/threonine protein kinase